MKIDDLSVRVCAHVCSQWVFDEKRIFGSFEHPSIIFELLLLSLR